MSALLRRVTLPGHALAVCLLASVALLAGAHAFERLGGMAPCLLCLDQRDAHWMALGVGLVGVAFALRGKERVVAAGLGALGLVYLFSAGLAAYHAGVEWGFWPGPQGCAAARTGSVSTADILGSLDAPGPEGPSCSEAAWRLLGVSMAGYNALASLALALVAGSACALFAHRMDRADTVA